MQEAARRIVITFQARGRSVLRLRQVCRRAVRETSNRAVQLEFLGWWACFSLVTCFSVSVGVGVLGVLAVLGVLQILAVLGVLGVLRVPGVLAVLGVLRVLGVLGVLRVLRVLRVLCVFRVLFVFRVLAVFHVLLLLILCVFGVVLLRARAAFLPHTAMGLGRQGSFFLAVLLAWCAASMCHFASSHSLKVFEQILPCNNIIITLAVNTTFYGQAQQMSFFTSWASFFCSASFFPRVLASGFGFAGGGLLLSSFAFVSPAGSLQLVQNPI